jgi:hypothetical protein
VEGSNQGSVLHMPPYFYDELVPQAVSTYRYG